jgi:hypothetical protein
MTDSRMMDDDTFREALNSAVDEVMDAFRRAWEHLAGDTGRQGVVARLWWDDNPFNELPRDDVRELEEYCRDLFQQFRGYNITGGTALIHAAITHDVTRSLREVASDETGPADVIEGKLADWQGEVDSAAYRFAFEYLPKLRSVLAAREAILGIADQTLAALGELRQERSTRDSDFLKALAADAISNLLGTETDPAKVVRTTLSMVGDTLLNSDLSVGGVGLVDVVNTMESAINNLVVAVIAEEELVRDAIANVHEYVSGEFRLDVLPLDVNRPEPAPLPVNGPL